MISQKIIFTGRVQGVGFRYQTKQLARGFEVTGQIKNLPDGSVELLLSGESDELHEFLAEIIQESDLAHHIKDCQISEITPPQTFQGFAIAQ